MSSFEEKERKRRSAVRLIVEGDREETSNEEKKKSGRPKLQNRELKKRYNFTVFPSVYQKASDKAAAEGKTLSELVNDFLTEYAKE